MGPLFGLEQIYLGLSFIIPELVEPLANPMGWWAGDNGGVGTILEVLILFAGSAAGSDILGCLHQPGQCAEGGQDL